VLKIDFLVIVLLLSTMSYSKCDYERILMKMLIKMLQRNLGVCVCVVLTTQLHGKVSVCYRGLGLAVAIRTPSDSSPQVIGPFSGGNQEAGSFSLTRAEDLLG